MENFSLINSHNLLDNPLSPIQDLNTNFLLDPNSRKAEISYIIQCDVGASKNAEQAFSTPRLSSHFFYLKFLVFVSVVHQISIFILTAKEVFYIINLLK